TPTPRSANSRDNTGEISRSNSRSSAASTDFSSQRRPVKERATPKAATSCSIPASSTGRAAVARLDPAHRAGGGPHHHAFGGDEVAMPVHAAQHGAVGDAGGGKHHIARHQIQQTVFAVQVLDAPFCGAAFFILIAEHQPPLHLPADA